VYATVVGQSQVADDVEVFRVFLACRQPFCEASDGGVSHAQGFLQALLERTADRHHLKQTQLSSNEPLTVLDKTKQTKDLLTLSYEELTLESGGTELKCLCESRIGKK
jgi:hypothetical protein